jgi:serine/threonine protein kinase
MVANSCVNDYKILHRIKKGTTSVVKLAEHIITKQKCAIKIFNLDISKAISNQQAIQFSNEVAAFESVTHENLIELVDARAEAVYQRKDDKGMYKVAYICTEYSSSGDFFVLI